MPTIRPTTPASPTFPQSTPSGRIAPVFRNIIKRVTNVVNISDNASDIDGKNPARCNASAVITDTTYNARIFSSVSSIIATYGATHPIA
ncbi:hypothetical protein ACWCXB_24300 [Streptomyces sp. NPDC001514]